MDKVPTGVPSLGVRDKVDGGRRAPAPGGREVEAGGLAAERRGVGVENVGAGEGDTVVDLDIVGGAVHATHEVEC